MTRQRFDIRAYKKDLRAHYKALRQAFDPEVKRGYDEQIRKAVMGLEQYRRAKTMLCFVSLPIEVDTHNLIDESLSSGKQVAVPYCVDGTRDMRFYLIHSRDQLVQRSFGVLEPVPEQCEELTDFADSICILPGLAFDLEGYRLGYGGGYYDRFLSGKYQGGVTVGVCYKSCVRRHLHHGRYDMPCNYLATEAGVRKIEIRPEKRHGKSP